MDSDDTSKPEEQLRQQYAGAADMMLRSVRAWNDLLATSTDMAFDVVLKNWDYSRSLRSSAEQAVADAIRTQHRLSKEMRQAWQGYSDDVKESADKSGE
jgi:gas vesicle protein